VDVHNAWTHCDSNQALSPFLPFLAGDIHARNNICQVHVGCTVEIQPRNDVWIVALQRILLVVWCPRTRIINSHLHRREPRIGRERPVWPPVLSAAA
jgi:hypothetical protein